MRARDRGESLEEIAAQLGVSPEVVETWFLEADRVAKARFSEITPKSMATDLYRRHLDQLALLARLHDRAEARGDTRTVLDIAREHRQALKSLQDLAADMGAFAGSLLSSKRDNLSPRERADQERRDSLNQSNLEIYRKFFPNDVISEDADQLNSSQRAKLHKQIMDDCELLRAVEEGNNFIAATPNGG